MKLQTVMIGLLCLIQSLQMNFLMATSVYEYVEESFYPSPDIIEWNDGNLVHSTLSTVEKAIYYSKNALPAAAGVSAVALGAVVYGVPGAVGAPIAAAGYKLSKALFSEETESLEMEDEIDFQAFDQLPKYVGFADSFFQSCGLGTSASATPLEGTCSWDKWLTEEHIEMNKGQEFPTFFVDYLDDPTPLIQLLKEMNVTAYRFSLERSVIEPTPGRLSLEAVEKYRNLFKKLKNNGIEPWVTLHHFVDPEWFSQEGGFENLDNVDNFVEHACIMIRMFPEITYWMTFNEPGIYAFQSYIRGVYPPGQSGDFEMAAIVLRNLMIAHCKIYKEVKKDNPQDYGRVQIGMTHQWLKFLPFNSNPIERLACHQLSKFLHDSIFNFIKTGKLFIKVPGKVCIELVMNVPEWKAEDWFSFIGVQWYGFPRLKVGWNYGEEYPGYEVQNYTNFGITSGATAEAVMSFGPPVHPEELEWVLQEVEELKIPYAITEIGCDTMIQKKGEEGFKLDEKTKTRYLKSVLPIVARHDSCIGLFVRTLLRGQLEWDRGDTPLLGQIDITAEEDGNVRRIVNTEFSPAAEYLQDAFEKKKQSMRTRRSSASRRDWVI